MYHTITDTVSHHQSEPASAPSEEVPEYFLL